MEDTMYNQTSSSSNNLGTIPLETRQQTIPHTFPSFKPETLGSAAFREDYGIKYAYLAGAMYKGISSKEMVVAMGKASLLGFLGTGGLSMEAIESAILYIQSQLTEGQSYGMNLLANNGSAIEDRTVDLYLKYGIRFIEAASYIHLSPSLVRYRLTGIKRAPNGSITIKNRVMAKISRPEVAEVFMRPAPKRIVGALLAAGSITAEEAELSQYIPVAHEICIEADSGGHTDQGVAYALMPAISTQRDQIMLQEKYATPIRIGAAGGIGTPEAAVAAFMMKADFILTGSINQCTIEAGTSDAVKEMLETINVQDTDYAPAGDLFEIGARVQVLRKGVFFPARANKLYELYLRHESIDDIDPKNLKQIEEKYFKRTIDEVWEETRAYLNRAHPGQVAAIESNPKQKMAMIFRWYFIHTTRLAMSGSEQQKVDYQVHCGPAMGAFNQWVKGSHMESWRNRRVAEIGERIMHGAANLLTQQFAALQNAQM